MTARNDETGTQGRSTSSLPTSVPQDPDATRAANPVLSPSSAMTTTAEIPVTDVRTAASHSGSAGYRDDAWYHDRNRKAPAPVGLRIAVWLLFAIFVVFLIGLAIEHSHPTWVSFLRQTGTITGADFIHFP